MTTKPFLALLPASLVLFPTVAMAHPGHDHIATFADGISHPVSGLDHMLAMVMVGLFAVQIGGKALWQVPLTFVTCMALGSLAGVTGLSPAMVEGGIGLSIVMLGGAIALRRRWSTGAAMALVGAVALVHGHAHGAEAHGAVSPAYLAGFMVSTALLHATGVVAGLGLGRLRGGRFLRLAGAFGATAGLALMAG